MFGHDPFYYSTIRNSVIAFGTLFNDMKIERRYANGALAQMLSVPLTYAPKDKLILRSTRDPDASKPDAITLPRMSFEITGALTYDGMRRLPPLEKVVVLDPTNGNKLKRQYIPVPYNIPFELNVFVNHVEDGTRIVEQIKPFFTPDWTVSLNLMPETEWLNDVPIVLNGVSPMDKYDGSFTDRRVFIWTLSFTMKTYFYGPVKSKPIIKFAYERFLYPSGNTVAAVGNTDIAAQIEVQPGLTANGTPTSNIAESVNTSVIFANNDFGFIETVNAGPIVFE